MNTLTSDVVVVGGGAAGLSAAVALARSLRSVVVVDAGEPRNAPAGGAHNVLEVDLADGATLRARRLLLATGLVDDLPELPGIRQFWGTSVLHCPYCHGWEVRGQRIGVLGTTPMSVHQALLFRQLSEHVTLLRHAMPHPDEAAAEQLAALGIPVVESAVERLRSTDGVLRAVVLEDGREVPVDAVVVAPRFVARTELYEQLGGTPTEHPFGTFLATDATGRTEVPGVWAAGNTSDLAAMVSVAAGSGVVAAAAVNADLVAEDADAAVRTRSGASSLT
jgi:thioredoxin reductase (NADPH)